MDGSPKRASEAAATAPKARDVASRKPTLSSNPSRGWGAIEDGQPDHFFRWPKRGGEWVIAQISAFGGKLFLDIRHWVPDSLGELKPTKKGATLPLESIEELAEALSSVTRPDASAGPEHGS
jgi:hypothetical protein